MVISLLRFACRNFNTFDKQWNAYLKLAYNQISAQLKVHVPSMLEATFKTARLNLLTFES